MSAALAIVPAPQPLEALVEAVVLTLRSEHSRRAYGSALRRFLQWADARHLPFSRDTVRQYLAELQNAGASSATTTIWLAAVRSLARESMDSGACSQAVATAIIAVRGPQRQQRRTGRWLSQAEAKLLADVPDNVRDRAILALLLGCGLRRAELCSLTVGQLQQLAGRTVLADVKRKRGKFQTLVISDWVAKRLEAWLGILGSNAHCAVNGDDLDIERHQGCAEGHRRIFGLSESGIAYIVDRWSKAAGVKVSPHDCRRTASLLALKGGADLRSVQAMLGHSSVQTTERYLKQALDLESPACDRIIL